MNWYVKNPITDGQIEGPFSQELALERADCIHGFVFSEEIFDPKFVLSEKTENLLGEMKGLAGMRSISQEHCSPHLSQAQGLLKRAVDTIILLSREKELPEKEKEKEKEEEEEEEVKVEGVVEVLNDLVGLNSFLRDGFVINRAIDMFVFLANRRLVPLKKELSDDETIGGLVSELNTASKVWDGDLMQRALTALLLLSSKVQNKDSLSEIAQKRLIKDLKECDCCTSLCHRAIQAIQGV